MIIFATIFRSWEFTICWVMVGTLLARRSSHFGNILNQEFIGMRSTIFATFFFRGLLLWDCVTVLTWDKVSIRLQVQKNIKTSCHKEIQGVGVTVDWALTMTGPWEQSVCNHHNWGVVRVCQWCYIDCTLETFRGAINSSKVL